MTARKQSMTARAAPSSSQAPAEPASEDYGDLEGDLCDVTNMAGILSDMVEYLVQFERQPTLPAHIYLPKENEDRLSYAAHEVSAQLLALKDRFYAILNAENESKRSKKGGAA